MKIFHIGPAHPLRGGIANFNETLAHACKKSGHESKIFSYSLQYPNILFPGQTQFTKDPYKGTVNIETCINSVNPLSWIRTGIKIKKQAPDVLVIHLWMPFFCPALGTITRIVKRNRKTKVVVLCHNVIPHEKKLGDTLLTNWFIPKADGYISMSKSVLTDLEQFTSSTNKLFIPHPIYDIFGEIADKKESKEKLGLDTSSKYILFFGMVRQYKGLDLLIDAFAKFRKNHKDVKLLVAGEFYDKIESYQQQIAMLGISGSVILHNEFIATEDVRYFFSASDIVAQTYKTATQSGVTQIAYHFHRPMLVTNVGGLAEIVPESVGYIADKDARKIADKLDDFFTNNREAEMAANVAKEKHRFSWELMVEGIEKLLK